MTRKPRSPSSASPFRSPRGRKSWREKLLDDKDLPKTVLPRKGASVGLRSMPMLVPAPREVDALMRRVPSGKVTTIDELRAAIAKKHELSITCPITTGIFAWISAHAADEAAAEGRSRITPYWRTLKAKGENNPKYPGGIDAIAERLEAEGHKVLRKGKRAFVAAYEKALVRPAPP